MQATVFERLAGRKIVILGYGVNHEAMVGYLLRLGIRLTIRDRDPQTEKRFLERYKEYKDKVTWEIRPNITADLKGFEIIFRTPGISLHDTGLQTAVKEGAQLLSQTELFFELSPAPIIGVTGTNGKGTTCTLITKILEAGYGKGKIYLGGNIGQDPFAFLTDLQSNDLVVLELSSFQLEGMNTSPHIAVLLHVTGDHLDHHRDLEEYRRAKLTIISHQKENDIAIVNADYPDMQFYLNEVKGKIFIYRRHQPGRQCAWVDIQNGQEVVFYQVDNTLGSFPVGDRKLKGGHNLENILPATIVGALYQIPSEVIGKVVRDFAGLPHRLSRVNSVEEVEAYDDSIATTPYSAQVALEAFEGRRIHVLAGGADKGQEYPEFASAVAERCVSVCLLPGAATHRLEKALHSVLRKRTDCSLVVVKAPDHETTPEGLMKESLRLLQPHVQKGDVILLSPAASSVGAGPFLNYKERGDAFVAAVTNLFGGKS